MICYQHGIGVALSTVSPESLDPYINVYYIYIYNTYIYIILYYIIIYFSVLLHNSVPVLECGQLPCQVGHLSESAIVGRFPAVPAHVLDEGVYRNIV
jgi:hypothetical protein